MKLGVIGGLGPAATAYFMELIVKMTEAKHDYEHLEMIIYNCPSIPDRTDYILGKCKDNPAFPMINIGKKLEEQGVDYISIPCITAHYFYDSIAKEINVPIINILKETVMHLKENGIRTVGIAATDGTIKTQLLQRELKDKEINFVLPSERAQHDVMDLVYKNLKAGQRPDMDKFFNISKELKENGAEVIVLGCTELSLIKRDYPIGEGYIDAMEVLSRASILYCNGLLKDKFKSLIK